MMKATQIPMRTCRLENVSSVCISTHSQLLTINLLPDSHALPVKGCLQKQVPDMQIPLSEQCGLQISFKGSSAEVSDSKVNDQALVRQGNRVNTSGKMFINSINYIDNN